MFDACKSIGANKMSYHFYSDEFTENSNENRIFSKGYPQSWVLRYGAGELSNCDPIPDAVMREGKIMAWGDVLSKIKLSEGETRFIGEARKAGLTKGIGVPLWGPKDCDAFAAVGFEASTDDLTEAEQKALRLLLQAGHDRICELTAEGNSAPQLSERETEILTWAAKGKSNTDIAAILSLSPDTVRTYMQRVFGKLGSRNRIGAAIRALKLGLIRL